MPLFKFPSDPVITATVKQLTTGKNGKEYSSHVPDIKCIGQKQLV